MSLRLKNKFKSMSDANLERTAFDVITAMTDNGNFLAPKPDALVMAERAQNFTVALNDCKTGDRTKIALKNAVRALLVEGIAQWRLYVLSESNNNRAIAGTSGFTISPEPASREPLTKPDPLKVSNGNNSGELVLKGKRVPNAISYIFQIATLENMTSNQWTSFPGTKIKLVVPDLSPGILYYCRLAALGSNNQLVYSNVIGHMAM